MSLSDFNDLHVTQGIDAVREAILAARFPEPDTPAPSAVDLPDQDQPPVDAYSNDIDSPRPSEQVVARFTLDELLQRFSLAMPDGKIWDARDSRLIKVGAAKAWWGDKIYRQWLDDARRSTVMQDDVQAFAAAAQLRGRGGLGDALRRYVFIYPSDTVWDRVLRDRVPVSVLKLAIADVYESWIKHPERDEISASDLVFDPCGPLESDGRINTFRGLPLEPTGDPYDSGNIQLLILHLVNNDVQVFDWLIKWLAYPLQHVGAKMATAVLIHSETQGSGKSLLFEEVIKPIYGQYGATLGQHQLESAYTDWRSNLLFALFEEIFSRESKFSHTGTMKQMITGKTQRIEKKFVSGWEESNHMNAVFLSNEVQPFPLDPSDRRMLVVWPEKKLPIELRDAVLAEIKNGGVQAFYSHLRTIDLGAFNTHTEPVMTDAKERLIDYSRFSWDLFHRDWRNGRTPWPYVSCLVSDLYKAYRRWCQQNGERDLTLHKFSNNISTRERRRKDVDYELGGYAGVSKGTVIQVGSVPDGLIQKAWFGNCIREFQDSLKGVDE